MVRVESMNIGRNGRFGREEGLEGKVGDEFREELFRVGRCRFWELRRFGD